MQGIDYIGGVSKVDDYTFVISYTGIYPGYLTQFAASSSSSGRPLLRCRAGLYRLGLRPRAVERRPFYPPGVGRRRPHDLRPATGIRAVQSGAGSSTRGAIAATVRWSRSEGSASFDTRTRRQDERSSRFSQSC